MTFRSASVLPPIVFPAEKTEMPMPFGCGVDPFESETDVVALDEAAAGVGLECDPAAAEVA